ncbi:MAG: DUF7507 domain-containing protein, partial [Bacteroidota bacterium]
MVIFFASILSSIAGNTNDVFIGNDARDASVEIELDADKSSVSQVDEIITYTYTVTNNGDETLTNVSVTDDKLGEISLKKNIIPSDIATGSAEYTVTQNDLDAGDDIENEATVTTNQGITDTDDESVSIIQQPDLTVTKTASPVSYSSVGEDISYTIKVENSGNVTVTDITVTDPLTGMTENIASLASGDSETYTETYTITQDDLNSGTVENTATATGEAPDDDVTASDTETITGSQQPALSITKTASPATFNSAGEEITYTIVVEN